MQFLLLSQPSRSSLSSLPLKYWLIINLELSGLSPPSSGFCWLPPSRGRTVRCSTAGREESKPRAMAQGVRQPGYHWRALKDALHLSTFSSSQDLFHMSSHSNSNPTLASSKVSMILYELWSTHFFIFVISYSQIIVCSCFAYNIQWHFSRLQNVSNQMLQLMKLLTSTYIVWNTQLKP